ETYCPKVIVLIGPLPDTLADRAITIQMRRRYTHERIERFILRQAKAEAAEIRTTCEEWAKENRSKVQQHYETTDVPSLQDREAELWAPLFAVCAVTDPQRLAELEAIAQELAGTKAADEPGDFGIKLLGDIRQVFDDAKGNRLATDKLLESLNCESES